MAMQKAMPYGKKLNLNEMQELFTQLFACEQPQLSPIGKKVFTKLNLAGIEKLMQHD